MLGITDLTTYVIGTIAIVLLPGPNSMFVLATAAQRGVRAGYRAATGVWLGDAVLMIATALGVASALRAYPPAFTALKYAGAAYLGYLGVRMIIGAVQAYRRRGTAPAVEAEVITETRPMRRAFVISLINPKAILFLVTFFTQFVDPAYPRPAVTFLALGVILQIFSVLYLSALIFGGTYLANQFRRRRRLAAAGTSAVGALFLGFGLKLATASLT